MRPARRVPTAGQGTVEYALVTAAFLVVAAVLALLGHAVADGAAAQQVVDALSHRLAKGVLDIALF